MKITPKYVNAAKPGGKYGNVAIADKTRFFVKQEHLGSFTIGVEIEVESRTEKWGDNHVTIISPVFNAHNPASHAPSPAPSNGNGNGHKNGGHDAETNERIYVCGLVNNWMQGVAGTRAITTADIVTVTNAARDAYRQTFGAK